MTSFLKSNVSSRGIRNNNPGNLIKTAEKWQGKVPHAQNTDKNFEQFFDVHYGLRAMYKDLINDINKGKNTVRLLISEYAPSHENNTDAYIKSVCSALNVKPDEVIKVINHEFLMKLGRAIVKKENKASEQSLITDAMLSKAISLIGNVSTPKLKVETSGGICSACGKLLPYLLTVGVFFYSVGTLYVVIN